MEFIYSLIDSFTRSGCLPQAFEHRFMMRALLACFLIGPMLGSIGTLVISHRLVFYSQTISHASLTGVALGLYFGEPMGETYAGLYGFSLLTALIMLFVKHQSRLSTDTITGVILTQVLGVGVIAMVLVTQQFNIHQIEAILFGSLITITDNDLFILFATLVLFAGILLFTFNRIMLIGLNPILARMHGTPVMCLQYLLVICITLVIVASLKMIGAMLVLALMVIPAASAQNTAQNLFGFFWTSIIIGTISSLGGLMMSTLFSIPLSAAIVLLASLLFYLSLLLRPWLGIRTGAA